MSVSSGERREAISPEPSCVLRVLGTEDLAQNSIRFPLDRLNTWAHLDSVAGRVIESVERPRELSPT